MTSAALCQWDDMISTKLDLRLFSPTAEAGMVVESFEGLPFLGGELSTIVRNASPVILFPSHSSLRVSLAIILSRLVGLFRMGCPVVSCPSIVGTSMSLVFCAATLPYLLRVGLTIRFLGGKHRLTLLLVTGLTTLTELFLVCLPGLFTLLLVEMIIGKIVGTFVCKISVIAVFERAITTDFTSGKPSLLASLIWTKS